MKNWLLRLGTLMAALGFGGVALAHGPYDSSAELMVLDESLELSATLGTKGARQLLLNAGLSETDAAAALQVRGPSTHFDLSVELAPRFFELHAGGTLLKPQRLRVITDGLEARFTVTYDGKYSGDFEVRARYFDTVPEMKPGAFTAMDQNRSVKSRAAFSRANATTQVHLPTPAGGAATKVPAAITAPAPENVSTAAPPPLAAPESSTRPSPSRSWVLWVGGVILIVSLIWGVSKGMGRSR